MGFRGLTFKKSLAALSPGFRGLTFEKSVAAFSAESEKESNNVKDNMKDDELVTPRTKHLPPPPRPPVDKNDVYTVGIDLEGNTILRMQSGHSYMTTTLTPFGVRQMIKLLEATLPDDEEDDNTDDDGYEIDSEYNK